MDPLKVLEVCPYEPPASGWVNRVKLLRRVIEERGGRCEILDIGPSRTVERPGCICVYGARDFLRKVRKFAADGFVVHAHVNGRYFRGMLLALAAMLVGRLYRCRTVVTFHAGLDQPFLQGWRAVVTWPVYAAIFFLSKAVICNTEAVKERLGLRVRSNKVFAIPAFSKQYLEYQEVEFEAELGAFIQRRSILLTTYICYRPGFYTEVLQEALEILLSRRDDISLVIIGTGDEEASFRAELLERGTLDHVFLAGNVDHDTFLSLLSTGDLHLRTPTSDGSSSTVLEALSLGIPVLAAENGTRPAGVMTYEATDATELVDRLEQMLQNLDACKSAIPEDIVQDTAANEVDLLAGG